MAVVFQNSRIVKATGTSITIAAPENSAIGDLLICYIAKDDDEAVTLTSGSDWNVIVSTAGNAAMRLYVAWKLFADGDTQWTWKESSEDYYGVILRYTGHDATTPIYDSGSASGVDAAPIAPSVAFTNLTAGSLVLQMFGADNPSKSFPYNFPAQLASRFNDEAGTIGGAGGEKEAPAGDNWISPTGFNDPDTAWTNGANVYDNNTVSYAINPIPATSWSDYLELTHSAISCSKVRFWAYYYYTSITEISLDVYYDDGGGAGWHNIYEGIFANEEWVEKEIGSTQTVTAMRVKFYNTAITAKTAFLMEVDFYTIDTTEGETGTAVFGMSASEEWAAATVIIKAAAEAPPEGDFTYTGTGSFAYSGTATQSHTRNYLTTASGQFAFSGSAIQVYSKNYLYEGSGSLAFSGSADQTFTFNYLTTASGSLIYSGTAIQVHSTDYLYTASGDFTYSGIAIAEIGFTYISSGQFAFSGSAICSYQTTANFEYVGSGSLAFIGTATQTHSRYYLYTGSGELTYSGEVTITVGFTCIGSGTCQFNGTGLYSLGLSYMGSGSFAYSGDATQSYTFNFAYIGNGTFAFSGIAPCLYSRNFSYSASGQLLYSGTALYSIGFFYIGSGDFTCSGTATQVYSRNYLYAGSGEFIYSGIAECIYETEAVFYVYVSSGQFTFGGTAFRFKEIITFLSYITKELTLDSNIIKELALSSTITKEISLASGITREVTFNSKINLETD